MHAEGVHPIVVIEDRVADSNVASDTLVEAAAAPIAESDCEVLL